MRHLSLSSLGFHLRGRRRGFLFSLFAAAAEGCNPAHMESPLTAQDRWPLLLKLPYDEQLRLAKLALHAASAGGREDRRAYQTAPPAADEFSAADDPLAWEGGGWDEY